MNANALVSGWNQSYALIQDQVTRFNNRIQHELDTQELDDIYIIIKQQFKHLTELEQEVSTKLNDVSSGKVISRKTKYEVVKKLNVITKMTAAAGAGVSAFTDNKLVGFFITLLGTGSSYCLDNYLYKLNFQQFQEDDLKGIAKQGVDQAHLIKKFIKRFKDIRKALTPSPPSVQVTQNVQNTYVQNKIDNQISNCLNFYETLPEKYRQNDGQALILSRLISWLPDSDPLKREMTALDTQSESLVTEATSPLPYTYMPPIAQEDEKKWTGENQARSMFSTASLTNNQFENAKEFFCENASSRFFLPKDKITAVYPQPSRRINLERTSRTSPEQNQRRVASSEENDETSVVNIHELPTDTQV